MLSNPSQVSKGSQDFAVQTHFSQNQSTDQSQPCLGLCPTTFPRSSCHHLNLLVETWQQRVCRMAHDGLCVLTGAYAPILTSQRGRRTGPTGHPCTPRDDWQVTVTGGGWETSPRLRSSEDPEHQALGWVATALSLESRDLKALVAQGHHQRWFAMQMVVLTSASHWGRQIYLCP